VIDTHSQAIIDIATFPTTRQGLSRAVAWINRRTIGAPALVLVAIEGIGSFGAQLAQHVAAAGFAVVESPSPAGLPTEWTNPGQCTPSPTARRFTSHIPLEDTNTSLPVSPRPTKKTITDGSLCLSGKTAVGRIDALRGGQP
jgi:hypothetical protein